MRAFCHANGEIRFGRAVPAGAIQIARGPSRALLGFLAPLARLGYDGRTLLVPGVPEAGDGIEGVKALRAFCDRLKPLAPEGIRVS